MCYHTRINNFDCWECFTDNEIKLLLNHLTDCLSCIVEETVSTNKLLDKVTFDTSSVEITAEDITEFKEWLLKQS